MAINIVLVDDHVLLRNGLADLLKSYGFTIQFQASNGREFISNLIPTQLPDIVLMDINMPIMDGFETTEWLSRNYPNIKVVALSMYDAEINIIKMIRCGARGYILKYAESSELILAINTIAQSGFYYSDLVNEKLVDSISEVRFPNPKKINELSDKEIAFLQFCCTEMSYKEIADALHLSPKTVDRYREILFEKLDIHSRTGLAMYAVRTGIVKI